MLDGQLEAIGNTLEGQNGGNGIVIRPNGSAVLSGNKISGYRKEISDPGKATVIEAGGGSTGEFDDESRFSVKFMETNHSARLLHHNKFMIFRNAAGEPTGVIYGAANFTGTGFDDNLENVYWSTKPEILKAFDTQFKRFWGDTPVTAADPEPPRATAAADMPAENTLPVLP